MAIDIRWVQENPLEAAQQLELLNVLRDAYRANEEKETEAKEEMQARAAELEIYVDSIKKIGSDALTAYRRIFGESSYNKVDKQAFMKLETALANAPCTDSARCYLIEQADSLELSADSLEKGDHGTAALEARLRAKWLRQKAEGGE